MLLYSSLFRGKASVLMEVLGPDDVVTASAMLHTDLLSLCLQLLAGLSEHSNR